MLILFNSLVLIFFEMPTCFALGQSKCKALVKFNFKIILNMLRAEPSFYT